MRNRRALPALCFCHVALCRRRGELSFARMFCYDVVAEPKLAGSAPWLLVCAARAWPAVLLWEDSLVRDAMEYAVSATFRAWPFARAVLGALLR